MVAPEAPSISALLAAMAFWISLSRAGAPMSEDSAWELTTMSEILPSVMVTVTSMSPPVPFSRDMRLYLP